MRFARPPRLGKWGAILSTWTLIAILFSGQWIAMLAARGEPFTWKVVFFNFSDSYTWALLTPAILWLGRRFPLDRHTWRRSLAVHVPAGVAITLAQLLMVVWVDRLVAGSMSEEPASFAQTLFLYSSRRFAFGIVTYWVVLGVGLAIDYYRLFRERELRASQLEARLARSQLQVLKMQLQPHFLFNTLHAISALVHEDADEADRMVAHLSELLRLNLENAGTQEVTLRQELEFLEPYLQIQRARFGNRLALKRDIAADVLDARVPNLLLQPLVENAVRHGIATRTEPGRIEISARRSGDALRIEVRDNGNGLPAGGEAVREGVGIGNTRARLQQLYGAAHRFEMRNLEGGGLRVTLEVPLRAENGTPEGEPDDGGAEDPGADRR